VGQVEDYYRSLEKQADYRHELEEREKKREISDFLRLTQEVIDAIIEKSITFQPNDYEWVEIDGEKIIGWCFYCYNNGEERKMITSDGRLVWRDSYLTKSRSGFELYFPFNMLHAKRDHRNILMLAEESFNIKIKKHWILKEDKKGLAKLFR